MHCSISFVLCYQPRSRYILHRIWMLVRVWFQSARQKRKLHVFIFCSLFYSSYQVNAAANKKTIISVLLFWDMYSYSVSCVFDPTTRQGSGVREWSELAEWACIQRQKTDKHGWRERLYSNIDSVGFFLFQSCQRTYRYQIPLL